MNSELDMSVSEKKTRLLMKVLEKIVAIANGMELLMACFERQRECNRIAKLYELAKRINVAEDEDALQKILFEEF